VAKFCVVCLLAGAVVAAPASAEEKPAASPDQPSPFTSTSRIAATIEIGLPALAAALDSDIPRRLATFDERINCVHRRVLVFRVNANCDVEGFVERTGPVSLYGRGDRIFGALPIYGAAAGQGANRFTAHIHGETEARATVEIEARPRLRPDWSLELNFSDGFHWSEPPYLHVLGRDIPLARYVEPRIRRELGHVSARALAAARRLDLRAKAAVAWERAFEPIKLADDPEIWLQLTPQSAAFAGVRANAKLLEGALEISGTAETLIGHAPPSAAPTPLPPLGAEVTAPGAFDVILPIRVGYDVLRQKVMEMIAAMDIGETRIEDVQIYPSSGKLVVGLRVRKSSDTAAYAGEWVYFSGAPKIDDDEKTIQLPDLTAAVDAAKGVGVFGDDRFLTQLREKIRFSYHDAYQKLLAAANQRLARPLQNGFRMDGHLESVSVDKVLLLPDSLTVALRASGNLKIIYGL
jgi:Domain of unknown function (DUF4403)